MQQVDHAERIESNRNRSVALTDPMRRRNFH
jgi:hypothetical protein